MKIKNVLLGLVGSFILLTGINVGKADAQRFISCSAYNRNSQVWEKEDTICRAFVKEDSSYLYVTYIWDDNVKTRIRLSKRTGAANLLDSGSPVSVNITTNKYGNKIVVVSADTYIMFFELPE